MHDGSSHGVDGPSQALLQPSAEEVRAQLERLVASPDFDVPARARKFLRYIVEETLAGRADRIKAYSVGTEVFERDASFDAQGDPVVRIEAGRLRRALEHYYLVPGLSDPVIIDVPKGAYIPHFTLRAVPRVEAAEPPASRPRLCPRRPSPGRPAIPARSGSAVTPPPSAPRSWPSPSPVSRGGASRAGPRRARQRPGSRAGRSSPSSPSPAWARVRTAKIYAQGLTEEVLSQLARFKELSVLGRETTRSIPPEADMARLRRELGARYYLEGSVQTRGAPAAGHGTPARCRDGCRAVVAGL